jgi:hypothetical protein
MELREGADMERLSRRNILGAASVIAGGSVLPTAASDKLSAAPDRGATVDPIIGLIAEEDHFRTLGVAARQRAEARCFDFDTASEDPEVIATEGRADALYHRIVATPATTIRGVIAKLEFAATDPRVTEAVIADLRRMAGDAA